MTDMARFRVAVKNGEKVFIGAKGHIHADVLNDHKDEINYEDIVDTGFVDDTGHWRDREEMLRSYGLFGADHLNDIHWRVP